MISAFGVEHIAKSWPDTPKDKRWERGDYHTVKPGKKDRIAFTQAPDWVKSAHSADPTWVNGKLSWDTPRGAGARVEYMRRRDSRAAKLLGSYKNREVPINPHSSMGRAGSMIISEHRPLHTRKRAYVAAAGVAAGAAAAIHHKVKKSAFGVEHDL